MPWQRPTLKQLYERISRDFSGRLLNGSAPLARSVIAVLAKVWAGAVHLLYSLLAWMFLQVFIDTAEGEFLRRWARVFGLDPVEPAFASGPLSGSGQGDVTIPAGTLFVNQSSGLMYAAEADAHLEGGAFNFSVKALESGAAGNLAAGASLTLAKPMDGVQSAFTVGAGGISGGADVESDESLRTRLLERLKNPPRGGSPADYVAWAKEVAGVTRAWCYRNGEGVGTVLLVFVTDNAPVGPIPTPEMVERVKEHIEPLMPATVKELYVVGPVEMPIDYRIKLNPNTVVVQNAVQADLGDYLAREGVPGSTLYRSRQGDVISRAAGVISYEMLVPSADIEVPGGYLPVLGIITFEAA